MQTAVTPAELEARLAAFLADATGARAVTIGGLRRVVGGASRETWAFDARFDEEREPRPLILRRDPGPTSMASDRAQEFHVLRAVHAAGLPVPAVHWLGEDATALGAPFLVMDRIEGETLARRLLRDAEYAPARARMTGELGAILAGIHAVPLASPGLERLPALAGPESAAALEVARYAQLYENLAPEPHPVIELGLRWCARHVPSTPRTTLVHGDFRIGNVLFGPEGVRAILDWELAHRGDPMEDLGWMCVKTWRFGSRQPVGGLGERSEFFAAYEAAGGAVVEAAAVHFWEVFGNLKWAVICIGQARTHLDGGVPSIELASLGRRTAEVEHDLLALLE